MKKIIFLFLVFAGFMACENETIQELPQENSVTEGVTARKNQKVDVCHKGKIINISINAVSAHQGHGDAIDMDGDGYFDLENDCTEDIDCDDTNAEVYPGAEEICDNGIDDNCDGQVDEDCFTFTCGIDQNWENLELTDEYYLPEDCRNYDCGGYTIPRVSFTVLDSEGNRFALFIVYAFDLTNYTCAPGYFDDYRLGVYYYNYQTGEECLEEYGCPGCGDSNMGPGTVELYNEAVEFINNLAAELGIENSCIYGERSSGDDSATNMQFMPDELKKIIEERKALVTPNK